MNSSITLTKAKSQLDITNNGAKGPRWNFAVAVILSYACLPAGDLYIRSVAFSLPAFIQEEKELPPRSLPGYPTKLVSRRSL